MSHPAPKSNRDSRRGEFRPFPSLPRPASLGEGFAFFCWAAYWEDYALYMPRKTFWQFKRRDWREQRRALPECGGCGFWHLPDYRDCVWLKNPY